MPRHILLKTRFFDLHSCCQQYGFIVVVSSQSYWIRWNNAK